jgi:hypothetical protein
MEDQFKEFIEVFKALSRQKVDYVLIGGVAVILHGKDSIRDKDRIDAIFLKKLIEAGKINQSGRE